MWLLKATFTELMSKDVPDSRQVQCTHEGLKGCKDVALVVIIIPDYFVTQFSHCLH